MFYVNTVTWPEHVFATSLDSMLLLLFFDTEVCDINTSYIHYSWENLFATSLGAMYFFTPKRGALRVHIILYTIIVKSAIVILSVGT